MIICNSHNFVVTRPPKTAGSSIEIYLLQSGLVNDETDEYTLEGNFSNWQEYKNFSDQNQNMHFQNLPTGLWGTPYLSKAQITFDELVEQERISSNMPCVGGIRHPLEWLSSLFYYINIKRELRNKQNLAEGKEPTEHQKILNEYWAVPDRSFEYVENNLFRSEIQMALKQQTDYYPDHAELFNVENIHEHVSAFIANKGGMVPTERLRIRESDHDPSYYINNLSEDRKKRALTVYEKDLVAWEKAYAKFN